MALNKVSAPKAETSSDWANVEATDASYMPTVPAKIGPGDDAIVGLVTMTFPITRAALRSKSAKGNAGFGWSTGGKVEIEGLGVVMVSGNLMAPKGETLRPKGATTLATLATYEAHGTSGDTSKARATASALGKAYAGSAGNVSNATRRGGKGA
jgi:hypothetical protein